MFRDPRTVRPELNGLWQALAVERRWKDYPQSQSYAKAQSVGWGLLDRFDEKHRAYHTGSHILALLEHLEAAKPLVTDPISVALAIWFHDAVYDPARTDNEVESANLARTLLGHLGESKALIDAVETMIMATIKHLPPDEATTDLKLFLDFDLSILGSSPETYASYAGAIRQEYAFVPDESYRSARLAVLQNFLARADLYFTDHGRATWDSQARRNLAAEIEQLSAA